MGGQAKIWLVLVLPMQCGWQAGGPLNPYPGVQRQTHEGLCAGDLRNSCRSLGRLFPVRVYAAAGREQRCGGGEVLQALKSGPALT